MKKLLRVDEACDAMGIGRTRMYELIKAGQIRSIPIGQRGRRIPVEEVERFIREGLERDRSER